jgi:hypothetical protein
VTPAHENPFRTSRLLALPASWPDTTPEALLARWRAAGCRGALVGPHGTGKTMRLRALAALLAAEGWRSLWLQCHDDGTFTTSVSAGFQPAFESRPASSRTVLCLDGSENLGPFRAYLLHRRVRRFAGVLATLHCRSWFLPTLARHAPDADLFVTHACALAPGLEADARAAFTAARGNAHEAFRCLYLQSAR